MHSELKQVTYTLCVQAADGLLSILHCWGKIALDCVNRSSVVIQGLP